MGKEGVQIVPSQVSSPTEINRRALFSFLRGRENTKVGQEQTVVEDNLITEKKVSRRLVLKSLAGITSAGILGAVGLTYNVWERKIEPSHETVTAPLTETDRSYNALVTNFSMEGGLFSRQPNTAFEATVWPQSNAFHALITYQSLLDLRRETSTRDKGLINKNVEITNEAQERYWSEKYDPPGYSAVAKPVVAKDALNSIFAPEQRYVDDSLWVADAKLRLIRTRPASSSNVGLNKLDLIRSQQVYQQALASWDEKGQGIFQKQQIPVETNDNRVVVSNAPFVQVALRLRELEPDEMKRAQYLGNAIKVYDWVKDTLLDDGMYIDNISEKNGPNMTKWTYSQGTMVGAGALLYKATGDETYLHDAERTARNALERYDTREHNLFYDPLDFIEIYMRNMLYLTSVTKDQVLSKRIEDMVAIQALDIVNKPEVYDKQTGLANFTNPYFSGEEPVALQGGLIGIFALRELIDTNIIPRLKYDSLI